MPPKAPNSPVAPRKAKPGPKINAGTGVSKPNKHANAGAELSRDTIFMYRIYLNGGTANWTTLAKQSGISASTAMRWFNRIKAGFEQIEAEAAKERDAAEEETSVEKSPVENDKPKKKANKKKTQVAVEIEQSEDHGSKPENEVRIKTEPDDNSEQPMIKIEEAAKTDSAEGIKSEEDIKSEYEDDVKSENDSDY